MGEHFDLYFAGWCNDDIMEIIINNDYNQLLSNINERDQIYKYIEAKKIGWKGKLLIDSGAFSIHKSKKEVPLQDYIDFLNANHEYLDYYIQLDDIPGEWGRKPTPEEVADSPKKTWENYLYMVDRLVEPKKLLPVFHQGEDFDYLRQMLEYRDKDGNPIEYICISSNKSLDAKRRYEWYKRCYDVIERSSNPNVKTHSLGTQSQKHINSIPFTSADATSWILSAGNGTLFTKYGTLYVSDHGLNLKKNIANGIAVDTIKEYFESKGFTLDELASSSLERVKWNLMYLGDWAKYERKYIGPKSFKIRRLF